MLKKAGTITAAVAGLLMLGSPAFAVAGEGDCHRAFCGSTDGHNEAYGTLTSWQTNAGDEHSQTGLLNFGQDSDLASGFNVCQVEINVIGVPVLSHNDGESVCMTSDDDENTEHVVVDND